jgi:hypothetical protein
MYSLKEGREKRNNEVNTEERNNKRRIERKYNRRWELGRKRKMHESNKINKVWRMRSVE